jgi:cation transport protein ChaC
MHENGYWVFAYGSLIWRPGFEAEARRKATLHGFHRSFCMDSIHYRGTPEAPGLVLALDRLDGSCCEGVAYRVGAATAEPTLAYLRERELVSSAYLEQVETVYLEDGEEIEAVCYVVDRAHRQYRGILSPEEQAGIIAHAIGPSGPNHEYLSQTLDSLRALDLHDESMEELHRLVAELRGEAVR